MAHAGTLAGSSTTSCSSLCAPHPPPAALRVLVPTPLTVAAHASMKPLSARSFASALRCGGRSMVATALSSYRGSLRSALPQLAQTPRKWRCHAQSCPPKSTPQPLVSALAPAAATRPVCAALLVARPPAAPHHHPLLTPHMQQGRWASPPLALGVSCLGRPPSLTAS